MKGTSVLALCAALAVWSSWALADDSALSEVQARVKAEITQAQGTFKTDASGDVVKVSFPPCHSPANDLMLSKLRFLPQVRDVRLTCPKVTDNGLEHLQALPNLERLFFNCVPITDKGLAHLQSCSQLKKLCLRYCSGVTPAGLAAFKANRPECEVTLDEFPKW